MKPFFRTLVSDNSEVTARQLAYDIIRFIKDCLTMQGSAFIALSGGSTPQQLYKTIAGMTDDFPDWNYVHFFWVDERCVPATSTESNFGNADRLFFNTAEVPWRNLHPVNGEEDPAVESVRYAEEIRLTLPARDGYPVFDLILLGMGDDGHTASLFPGQDIDTEKSSICAVSMHPSTGQKRITLTEPVINNAREVIFFVTGQSKAKTLKAIFEKSNEPVLLPAKRIAPRHGHLSWYLDKAAAELLFNPEN